MSGGHFDYRQYHIQEIAETLDLDLTESDYVREELSIETKEFMKETLYLLRDVAARVHALDYLLAGDIDEDSLFEYYERRKNNHD